MPCLAEGALCHVGLALRSDPPLVPSAEEGDTPPEPRSDPDPAALGGERCERVRREFVFSSGGASFVKGNRDESSRFAVDSWRLQLGSYGRNIFA